jgi:hypothetical protein
VELADLYLSGDRLPKNCEQARVLFRAASNANNTLAAGRLANVRKYGCK